MSTLRNVPGDFDIEGATQPSAEPLHKVHSKDLFSSGGKGQKKEGGGGRRIATESRANLEDAESLPQSCMNLRPNDGVSFFMSSTVSQSAQRKSRSITGCQHTFAPALM